MNGLVQAIQETPSERLALVVMAFALMILVKEIARLWSANSKMQKANEKLQSELENLNETHWKFFTKLYDRYLATLGTGGAKPKTVAAIGGPQNKPDGGLCKNCGSCDGSGRKANNLLEKK